MLTEIVLYSLSVEKEDSGFVSLPSDFFGIHQTCYKSFLSNRGYHSKCCSSGLNAVVL